MGTVIVWLAVCVITMPLSQLFMDTSVSHQLLTGLMPSQPQIFNTLGLTQTGSLLGTLVVSAVNILATIVAILAVDRCAPVPL